jgi:hypothetical protein
MVILSDNIFDLRPEAIRNVKVETTIVGQVAVTARENFSMKRRTIDCVPTRFDST